jgi:hypothetical protein
VVVDHECDESNSDWDGSRIYTCPECSDEISESELTWAEDEKDTEGLTPAEIPLKDREPEETLHNIIKPEKMIISGDIRGDGPINSSIICKACSHIFVFETGRDYGKSYGNDDSFCECPICGTPNSETEFQTLLKNGYFDKKVIDKKHDATSKKSIKTRSIKSLGKSKRTVCS